MFLSHCQAKKGEITVLTVCSIRGKSFECRFSDTEGIFSYGEGTFGNQEGMITDVFLDADWQSTPAFKLVPLLKRILKRYFRNASLLSIILSFNTFGVEYILSLTECIQCLFMTA